MSNVFKVFVLSLVLLSSCIFERFENENSETECRFDNVNACIDTPFSIVDADTYQNLAGYDGQLINPDSVKIVNTRGQNMYLDLRTHSNGWISFETFGSFQEIHCFNQCSLDSAFSRYYFVLYGYNDWDTIETHYPAQINYERWTEVYYNGEPAITDDTVRHASYNFEKTG